ncbi:hypothetical protein [Winogradskya humida]|uniref:Uncharacterized protein n=1 Tax=Winogradskya humida TaxID=113566 RepID=A0ABQ3ZPB1_9ACTN|nr:hypothetical protein [Actinoplanes humidus]GIE20420.1 hypothetical protein Ahu01nite_035220 [Actinoplanes humidus]
MDEEKKEIEHPVRAEIVKVPPPRRVNQPAEWRWTRPREGFATE